MYEIYISTYMPVLPRILAIQLAFAAPKYTKEMQKTSERKSTTYLMSKPEQDNIHPRTTKRCRLSMPTTITSYRK